MQAELIALRKELAALEQQASSDHTSETFSFGFAPADKVLGGGLALGGLHEVFAAQQADLGAATGFITALTLRAAMDTQAIVWVRQSYAGQETGRLYAPGLASLGCDPDRVILVELRDALDVLRAGLEAVRCAALGAVIIEPWGEPKVLDFTASRRLALAAAQSGVTVFLLRPGAVPQHSAAQTRWQVSAGASTPLAAGAPGFPVFDITLLRQRTGTPGQHWHLEWDHEQHIFRQPAGLPPLSRPVVPLPLRRQASAPEQANDPIPIARAQ